MISFFVIEIFKFSFYANLVTYDVIGCASTLTQHKIQNISANNAAMLLKLGSNVAPRSIPDGTHFDSAIATCSVPVSCLFKMKYCHLWLNKAKYLVLSKTYASPTFIKGSLSTSVLCGRWVVWQPFSLILKLQLSEPWPGFFWGFSAPVNSLWYGVLRRHYIVEFQYLFVFFFFYWIKFMPKKPWFCCGRAECRDLLRNVVGRQGIKKTRRFCCERALSISGTRGRSILVFREPPIANLQSFFYIVLPNGNLNKKVWEWLMVQRARRTQLQRTVSGLFCIEIRVSIAFPLFHLFAIVGDYS